MNQNADQTFVDWREMLPLSLVAHEAEQEVAVHHEVGLSMSVLDLLNQERSEQAAAGKPVTAPSMQEIELMRLKGLRFM